MHLPGLVPRNKKSNKIELIPANENYYFTTHFVSVSLEVAARSELASNNTIVPLCLNRLLN